MDKIAIADVELPIVEYQGQRVVTLGLIDRLHGRPDGAARKTFAEHRERLKCGVHYWKLTASEIRTRFPGLIPDRASGEIALVTERGYLMLVKSFSDDLAWEVQDQLVDAYFRARDRAQVAAPANFHPALPDFRNPGIAARAWAEQFERADVAEKALAEEQAANAELTAKAEELETKVEVLAPKAAVHDQITEAQGDRTIAEVAKILGTGQNRLFAQLREMKILQSNNLPYQHYLNSDYFRVCAGRFQKGGKWQAYSTTVVTGKGLTYLAKRLAVASVESSIEDTM